jgi:hypothetical protein
MGASNILGQEENNRKEVTSVVKGESYLVGRRENKTHIYMSFEILVAVSWVMAPFLEMEPLYS